MKQGNLFDAFSKSKKKSEAINSQSSVQTTTSQTVSTASTGGMVVETTVETLESKTLKAEIQLNDESIEHSNSKKRKSTALASTVLEEMNKEKSQGDDDFEIVQKSVKKIKLNIDETEEEPTLLKVTISQEPTATSPKAPKDISKLKRINDPEYNAYHDAPFWPGENVPFSFLTECFDEVSLIKGENSKDKIAEIIANMFRSILLLNPDQLPLAYYFCILKIAPDYETLNELGIGNEILVKAIAKSSGRSEKYIRDNMNQIGDLGKVAATSKATQSTMEKFMKKTEKKAVVVSLKQVIETFRKMPRLKGNNSNTERESLLLKLLFDAKGEEPKYIVRFVQKNLKIGAAEATMQSALVRAFLVSNYSNEETDKPRKKPWSQMIPDYAAKMEKHEEAVKRAICEHPNYDALIASLIKVGKNIEELQEICKIAPGIPVKPMLAKPTKGINIIFQRFENMKFTCEYKYDGLRGQIHYNEGKCQIFSRNLETMTDTYPDIVEFVLTSTSPDVKNFIIDSEIVAIHPETQKILPFQTLSTRSRKNVDKNAIEIQVCLYVFDIIYLNDQSLLKTPFVERRKFLSSHLKEVDNKLKFAQHLDTDNFEEIQEFLSQSVKVGCEGLMVKTLDVNSTYEPSKRSFKWLKLKKDYLDDGLGDSFDLVPIGALFGKGKRTGLYSSYLLACYNPDMERYETICKVGTGFSEENLIEFHKFFADKIIKHPLAEYKAKPDEVDVWFEPSVVWEIKGADIQISPIYTAAIGEVDSTRGLGMRFPRLIKVRTDKGPTETTDPSTIVDIYKSQAAVGNKGASFDDDEDFY